METINTIRKINAAKKEKADKEQLAKEKEIRINKCIRKYYVTSGALPPTDILVGQTWCEIGAIVYTVYKFMINSIVEIGTDRGGLGVLLALQAFIGKDTKYLGIELHEENVEPKFLDLINIIPGASFLCADAFSNDCINHVSDFVRDGRALIFCDNGNKPREFETYAKILKPGDLLMVHDYPVEFNENNSNFDLLRRLDVDYLLPTRIVMFEKDRC